MEERLAELDLSAPAHRDSDAENDLSSETEGAMRSAFESYIRGMVGSFITLNSSFCCM